MELAELDSFILSQLTADDPKRASVLVQRFVNAYPARQGNSARIVDRSLQRLRRQCKISPAPKQRGWVLTP